MPDWTLTDFNGRPITVGTKVRHWDASTDEPIGVVVDLGEWDGDHDDEGRSIAIVPRITVQWTDGNATHYVTSEWEGTTQANLTGDESHMTGKVEEVNVVPS